MKQTCRVRVFSLAFILFGVYPANGLPAGPENTNQTDQAEVERRLAKLQQTIQELQQQLAQSRVEHKTEQAQLRALDLAIQETSRRSRLLGQQREQHVLNLEKLEQQRGKQLEAMSSRQKQLAAQINATYRLSRQSRVKLVLNQDNANELSRMLAYYDHINRDQIQKIKAVKAFLAEIEQTYKSINQELIQIQELQIEQQSVFEQQQAQRSERASMLSALSLQIDSDELQLAELENNRKDLEKLLERLSDVLADIPADLGQHLGVAEQKGRLPKPVSGRVLHAFGQQRAVGVKWQGWLLEAAPGSEVHTIGYGRVAFADWLRGYGLLIIIDHGQGYMSLYGYNESLQWEAGDWVEPGAVIATVGSNPGGEQGLYFELRKSGKAVDPSVWLKR
jgi:septal ring factor EnvC (AmiA/AmiB activator)